MNIPLVLVGNFTTLELSVSGEVNESTKNHINKWYVGTGKIYGGGKLEKTKSKDILEFRFKTQDSDRFVWPQITMLPPIEEMIFADVIIGGQQFYKLISLSDEKKKSQESLIDELISMIFNLIKKNFPEEKNPMIEIPVFNLKNKAFGDWLPSPSICV